MNSNYVYRLGQTKLDEWLKLQDFFVLYSQLFNIHCYTKKYLFGFYLGHIYY